MKGLDLCRRYFHQVGLPALRQHFPDYLPRVACGLFGAGSDVFGFDDEISRDHNWGPRFRVILSRSDYETVGDRMQEVMLKEVPAEFEGYRVHGYPPGRGDRHVQVDSLPNVIGWALGCPEVPDHDVAWLGIAEHRLYELHAGEVWHDPQRLLLGLREQVAYFPEMVWRKRMAFFWEALFFADNFVRSAARGERFAEQMYLGWTLYCIMRLAFMLNRRYAPYRKWLHRAFRGLPLLADELHPLLTEMVEGGSPDAQRAAFRRALEVLGRATNDLGLIPAQPFESDTPMGGFYDFNYYGFASAIQSTITGPLARLAYHDGAPDQWAFDLGTAKPLKYPEIVRALFPEAWEAAGDRG
jgi:hypothetical protein